MTAGMPESGGTLEDEESLEPGYQRPSRSG